MKKILLFIVTIFLFGINIVYGIDDKINIYLFWGDGCPHCSKEKEFLGKIQQKYNNIVIKDFEVWYNIDNGKLLQKIGEKLNINISGVPFTIIGKNTISGYLNDSTTGKEIEEQIEYCLQNKCEDFVGKLLECDCNPLKTKQANSKIINENNNNSNSNNINKKEIEKISLPILGEIHLKDYSLPIITIIFGTIDGFNPCAMWILLFLMSILIGLKDRRKMWILGGSFILSSAIAYFLFISAWLNIIIFFGFLLWIKIGIGLFAIIGGGYNIKEYFKNKNGGCNVVGEEKRNKIFDKIKDILHKKSFFISIIGICILAFAVNIVELLCSAGLPVIYTQILTINKLTNLQYYLYILLYILFFMLDDLIVFIVSMMTLKVTGITTKYTKYSHLIGGILMLIIGILLIFKPEFLMFG